MTSSPPSSSNLPVFQQSPVDQAFVQNPYPAYDRMRSLGRAIWWADYSLVCYPHFEEVNAILRDRRFGREITHVMTRAGAGLPAIPKHLEPFYDFEQHSMLEREPPVHTRLRSLVNRAFVSRHIEQMRGEMAGLCHQLMDAFPVGEPFDLLPAYAEKIPVIVIARLLGVPVEMGDQLLKWSHAMVAMYQFNRTRNTEDEAVRATAEFSKFIEDHIEKRRSDPRDDLLTRLIEAEEDGQKLSRQEMITTAILLLNAGHEATVHGIGNAVKAILQYGVDIMSAFDDFSEQTVVDEFLRFDPPLHLFTRFVLEDLEYGGIPLAKGSQVGLLLGAANRDPEKFLQPQRIDFNRGSANQVAFGAGIHFCVGAPLARLEMAVALKELFARFDGLCLAEAPIYSDRYHFHGLERLIVRI